MIASLGMILIVALVAAALGVGITLLQQERRSMRGVDPDYIESLRQENRRLANLLEEYLLENKAISLNDQDLLERTVKELSHHRKRELGR
jgi:predicted outer membrane protein